MLLSVLGNFPKLCDAYTRGLCVGGQLRVKPTAFVVISNATLPAQAEQFLIIVVHESFHVILHLTCPFVLCRFHDQSRVSSLHPLISSSFPASSTLACPLSRLFLHCSGSLMYPCSFVFHFIDCVNPSVWLRASAYIVHWHSNLSRVGDRPHAKVGKSWSSFRACCFP